jgi:hypothetical protein
MIGLPQDDPMARMPLIDLTGQPQVASPQAPMFPWMPQPNTPPAQGHMPGCTVICISSQTPPQSGPAQPFAPFAAPPPPNAPPPWAQPPAAPPPPDPQAGPPGAPAPVVAPSPAPAVPNASPAPKPANPAQAPAPGH